MACGGYALTPGSATADLCWGMVHRDRRGQGIGRRLLIERIDRARVDAAVSAVALNTSQHTRGFYERFGFVTERVVPDGYAPGLDCCVMRRTF